MCICKKCLHENICSKFTATGGYVKECENLMDNYTSTEISYKNGYEKGVLEFVNYLKQNSFLCDVNDWHSFNAIDEDVLDDFVHEFLRDKH